MGKIKQILKWIATDGLLHILACYACMLTLVPMVGIWWTTAITLSLAVGKEVVDALRYNNTKDMMLHDFICDAAGLLLADVTIFVWWLCNL